MVDVSANFQALLDYILEEINLYTSINLNGRGLSKEELANNEAQIQKIVTNVRKSCSGDMGAREMTKEIIRDKISEFIEKNHLDDYILFDEFATPWTMFEAISYRANNPIPMKDALGMTEISNDPLKQGKKVTLQNKLGSIRPFFDAFPDKLTISEKDLRNYYLTHNLHLSYDDKIRILTQMVFASLYGLGVIDSLNYQPDTIEEIQIGMAGVLNQPYNYRNYIYNIGVHLGNHARDKVHVIVGGRTIALTFLSFKNNHELKRVIRNLIKDAGAGDLTEANPRIVTDTIDGRRVTVARPPFQDSWGGLIRKFSSVSVRSIEDWAPESEINDFLKLLCRSGANIGINGGMEVGKTTLARAFLADSDPTKNIRIIENGSFELNGRLYLPGRNVSSYKISENASESEVLAFVRKTTGHIFSIGELNSLEMANTLCNLSKFVPQIIWTGHHNSADEMIADFKNGKIACGFSSEKLAELEAAKTANIYIHLEFINGVRCVSCVEEIIPKLEEAILPQSVEEGLYNLQKQMGETKMYRVNPIFKRTENGNYKRLGNLSYLTMSKARHFMNAEDYFALEQWNNDLAWRNKFQSN